MRKNFQLLVTLAISFLLPLGAAAVEQIEVGALIQRVIAGEDFSGKEVTVTGVSLNRTTTGMGLLNVGTPETYRSQYFENYVSVYDTPIILPEGKRVAIRISIESSIAAKIGGKSIVTIEAAFLECIKC